jgi:outer membrane protein OmpA-like peptidoglycan-associated protein
MTNLTSEMLAWLLAGGSLGCLLGWLGKRLTAGRQMQKLAAEHEHTLSITETELQRLSAELAAQNKRANDAVASVQPFEVKAAESEAKLISALLAKDGAEAKVREQHAELTKLQQTLATRDREIGQLELNINKLNPLVTEVNSLRAQATAWERKGRQQEDQSRVQLSQRDQEITLLRGRIHDLEALPAKLVERDARVRDLDLKLRATEAAAQARIQTLETSLREADTRAQETARSLQAAEQQTAAILDERAQEIRTLRQRVLELEALSARWAETDQALATMRAELAEQPAPLTMAASVGGSLPSLAQAVAYSPAAPVVATEPEPLTPAELQGCLQSLLFERSLRFTPKSDDLDDESLRTLAEVAALMGQAPEVPVVIEGHTDNWGDPHTNWQLSLRRAEVVRAELVLLGVNERRLSCQGYGEARPIDDNSTPDGRWRNRRIEIRVAPVAGY